jgi:hypothetical protein
LKVADTADHRSGSYKVIAIRHQFLQQLGILRVTFNQLVASIRRVGFVSTTILAKVVQSNYLMPGIEQLLDQIATDKTSSTSD